MTRANAALREPWACHRFLDPVRPPAAFPRKVSLEGKPSRGLRTGSPARTPRPGVSLQGERGSLALRASINEVVGCPLLGLTPTVEFCLSTSSHHGSSWVYLSTPTAPAPRRLLTEYSRRPSPVPRSPLWDAHPSSERSPFAASWPGRGAWERAGTRGRAEGRGNKAPPAPRVTSPPGASWREAGTPSPPLGKRQRPASCEVMLPRLLNCVLGSDAKPCAFPAKFLEHCSSRRPPSLSEPLAPPTCGVSSPRSRSW